MNLPKYKDRFDRIDQLIRLRATGNPEEFASRLNISRSHLYRMLETMKELGAPISYSRQDKSYFYKEKGSFWIGFKDL